MVTHLYYHLRTQLKRNIMFNISQFVVYDNGGWDIILQDLFAHIGLGLDIAPLGME